MKEEEALKLLVELAQRHNVVLPEIKFLPSKISKTVLEQTLITITRKDIMYGAFIRNKVTGEHWIEFYGLPSKHTIIHEFKHYLEYLGVEYIRKKEKEEVSR